MKFKKINPKEKIFYVFKTSSIAYSIFDSFLDFPIYAGHLAMTRGIIKNIRNQMPKSKVFFYDQKRAGLILNPTQSHNL
jgi:hypothetical protein